MRKDTSPSSYEYDNLCDCSSTTIQDSMDSSNELFFLVLFIFARWHLSQGL